jgi:hypothetical protein
VWHAISGDGQLEANNWNWSDRELWMFVIFQNGACELDFIFQYYGQHPWLAVIVQQSDQSFQATGVLIDHLHVLSKEENF